MSELNTATQLNHIMIDRYETIEFLYKFTGGVRLSSYQSHTVTFPDHWSGRVWARTGCGSGSCETGDCGGGRLKCNGAGGIPPVTLAEITFDGAGGQDFYDVSLVDGYNVKMAMTPKYGTYRAGSGTYYCKRAGCNSDVNAGCPAAQMKVFGRSGQVVACKSACLAFNTDRYCCRGYYKVPQTCRYFPYARTFKNSCPQAYSYAYDDQKSTFTCQSNGGTKTAYTVDFC